MPSTSASSANLKRGVVASSIAPADVGGWPELKSALPPADGDRDGMPDEWERRHRLNAESGQDGQLDADGDGYTNIEEYLNGTDPRSR